MNIEPVGLVNTSLVVKINIVRKFFARREVRKLGWSAVSLLLPEVTVLIATYEKWVAKRLKEKMLQQFPDDQENPVRWGSDYLELPYFVIMGGFRVELERPDGPQASAGSGNFTGYQCVSRTNGQSCYCMDPWPLKSLESDDSNRKLNTSQKTLNKRNILRSY